MTDEPRLRVIRGTPTAEELAALVTVLAAAAGGAVPAAEGSRARGAGWRDHRAMLRRGIPPGPGAWAASGRAPGTRTRADW